MRWYVLYVTVYLFSIEILCYALFFFTYQFISGRPMIEDITGAIRNNELDGTFVIILMVFFFIIVMDRILYIYRSLLGKLLFQYLQVALYHVLFLVSYVLQRQVGLSFVGFLSLAVLFTFKCVYLWLSALQISKGYTKNTYIFFFASKFHWLYYYLFTGWRAIPFVFELKTLLDWTFTQTTLNFYYWIKMEDINAALYRRKCDLVHYESLNLKLGDKQPTSQKITGGLLTFIGIVILIFFPLLFYSNVNPTFEYNQISRMSLSVGLRGFENLYSSQIFFNNTDTANAQKYQFYAFFKNYQTVLSDFNDLDPQYDIQVFSFNNWADQYWLISQPTRERMIDVVANNTLLEFKYTIDRQGPPGLTTITASQFYSLNSGDLNSLKSMVRGQQIADIALSRPFNPFLINKASGLYNVKSAEKFNNTMFPNCTFGIRQQINTSLSWWNLTCASYEFGSNTLSKIAGPSFFVQSTKVVIAQGLTSYISSFGIIAFYTTFVLAVGRLYRTLVSDVIGRIFYEDLDDVDLLINYVQDIYLARANLDLKLEQTMYEYLIYIFRDPSLLMLWTKKKTE